ncbi:unnamed protein product [Ambrosiozyma monospora]|uniref:Unnamed protein product n=1 Tax=Ambrosiozyma monospora TaxID=43982 RepID=A0A9W6Z529_AMBMO|nr:unnamed protein product [Ambrosiozyma monospora]
MAKLVSLNARKQKILGIAALLLTILFLLSQMGSNHEENTIANESMLSSSGKIPSFKDSSSNMANANDLVKDKSGKIDEAKVKQVEENSHMRTPAKPLIKEGPKKAKDMEEIKQVLQNKDDGAEGTKAGGLKATKFEGQDSDLLDPSSRKTKSKGKSKSNNKILADTPEDDTEAQVQPKGKSQLSDNANKKLGDVKVEVIGGDAAAASEDNATPGTFDASKELHQMLAMAPVVVFSKSYCPYSKKLKDILKTNYMITPDPVIVELDLHEHGKDLQQLLGELTGRKTVPNLMIKGLRK